MMETFEKHQVSFVSVTQQFNTTHVDGPADAQRPAVVRPVRAGDHLRAHAGQDRGRPAEGEMVAGGRPVLGYDLLSNPAGPKLIVNDAEAVTVRAIFELYLKHQALIPDGPGTGPAAAGRPSAWTDQGRTANRAAARSTRTSSTTC